LFSVIFSTAFAAPRLRQVDVIPAPARVAFHDGDFAIHARTPISIPRDPGAARIALYLAGLLEESRGVRLRIVERSNDSIDSMPEGAIVLCLDQPVAPRRASGASRDFLHCPTSRLRRFVGLPPLRSGRASVTMPIFERLGGKSCMLKIAFHSPSADTGRPHRRLSLETSAHD
jgi:hypothetical protein